MKYHITKDNRRIRIKDLETSHLMNIINAIKNKAKHGMIIKRYVAGMDSEDIWYDEDLLYGKAVKRALHFKAYKKELKRRRRHGHIR